MTLRWWSRLILSAIRVQPNPAQEGGNITISGAPGEVVFLFTDGSATSVTLDSNGKATVPVPKTNNSEVLVTDGRLPKPSTVVLDVVSNLSGK